MIGLPGGLAAALSMIGTFCGVVNAPLASIFLGIEMFGTGDIILFAIVCAISYVCSGYYSLYSSQTIIQDKVFQAFLLAYLPLYPPELQYSLRIYHRIHF